jgi:hypothetical protein
VPLDLVPEPLWPLVAAGMAKEPENRPADATTTSRCAFCPWFSSGTGMFQMWRAWVDSVGRNGSPESTSASPDLPTPESPSKEEQITRIHYP